MDLFVLLLVDLNWCCVESLDLFQSHWLEVVTGRYLPQEMHCVHWKIGKTFRGSLLGGQIWLEVSISVAKCMTSQHVDKFLPLNFIILLFEAVGQAKTCLSIGGCCG